jgi:hypothetical protein
VVLVAASAISWFMGEKVHILQLLGLAGGFVVCTALLYRHSSRAKE